MSFFPVLHRKSSTTYSYAVPSAPNPSSPSKIEEKKKKRLRVSKCRTTEREPKSQQGIPQRRSHTRCRRTDNRSVKRSTTNRANQRGTAGRKERGQEGGFLLAFCLG